MPLSLSTDSATCPPNPPGNSPSGPQVCPHPTLPGLSFPTWTFSISSWFCLVSMVTCSCSEAKSSWADGLRCLESSASAPGRGHRVRPQGPGHEEWELGVWSHGSGPLGQAGFGEWNNSWGGPSSLPDATSLCARGSRLQLLGPQTRQVGEGRWELTWEVGQLTLLVLQGGHVIAQIGRAHV